MNDPFITVDMLTITEQTVRNLLAANPTMQTKVIISPDGDELALVVYRGFDGVDHNYGIHILNEGKEVSVNA